MRWFGRLELMGMGVCGGFVCGVRGCRFRPGEGLSFERGGREEEKEKEKEKGKGKRECEVVKIEL